MAGDSSKPLESLVMEEYLKCSSGLSRSGFTRVTVGQLCAYDSTANQRFLAGDVAIKETIDLLFISDELDEKSGHHNNCRDCHDEQSLHDTIDASTAKDLKYYSRIFCTADIGRINSDGQLEIRGRDSGADVVKIRGGFVSIADVEVEIMNTDKVHHDRISQCAVVDIGNQLCCCFVLKDSQSFLNHNDMYSSEPSILTFENYWYFLRQRLLETLPIIAVPNRWKMLDRLPTKAGSGKLDKASLVDLLKNEQEDNSFDIGDIDNRSVDCLSEALNVPEGLSKSSSSINDSCSIDRNMEVVVKIFADVLQLRTTTEVTIDSNFFFSGGDSITVILLLEQLSVVFGSSFRLDVAQFLQDPTVRSILQHINTLTSLDSSIIDGNIHSDNIHSDMNPTLCIKANSLPDYLNMNIGSSDQNLCLQAFDTHGEINKYKNLLDLHIQTLPQSSYNIPSQVRFPLISGSTGFIGINLLGQLLRDNECTDDMPLSCNANEFAIKVRCLVRKSELVNNIDTAMKMQADKLARHGFDTKNSQFQCLLVDYSEDHFGLSEQDYSMLCRTTSIVYNCAGKVDILAPYSSQVHANVDVTMQLLKFALDSRAIFFHISTSAVFPPRDNINFKRSCNDLYYDDSMDLLSFSHSLDTFALYGGYYEGYLQSKFVAEMLVWHAIRHQKLMGAVFRPSNVGKKGQVLDGFSYIVKRCIQMKKFPLPPPNVICGFGWISVDALCGFILDMSRKSRDEWNDRAYHLQSADLGLQKLLSHFQNVNRITLNEWTGLPPLLWLDYAIPLNKSVDYDENSKHRHHRGCQIHNEEKFARERKIEAIFKTVPSAIDGVLGYCELPMNSSQAFLDSPHVNNEIKMFLDCYT